MEMEKELYVAAMNGDTEFLDRQGENKEVFLGRSPEGNNVFHIAIQCEQLEFIESSLRKLYPDYYKVLLREGNSRKENPLHVAAEVGNLDVVRLLYDYLEKSVVDENEKPKPKPWMAQNLERNTAVHVALVNDNLNIAKFLLDKDLGFARVVNKSKEAPLHLAIRQLINHSESGPTMKKIQLIKRHTGLRTEIAGEGENMIRFLVQSASSVANLRDAEGMTPLHRAASLSSPNNLWVTKFIFEHCPQSAEVFDASGKSVLHLLIDNKIPSYDDGRKLFESREIYALRNRQDRHGNTPLHIAALKKDAIMLLLLLELPTKLNIKNRDDISAISMIQQHDMLQMLEQRRMTKEEYDEANISFLSKRVDTLGKDFLLSRDDMGRNVLHILMDIKEKSRIMYKDFVDFVARLLEMFPALVCQVDETGDTPVHILARNSFRTFIYIDSENYDDSRRRQINDSRIVVRDVRILRLRALRRTSLQVELLEMCNKFIVKNNGDRINPPWLVQNARLNTPLHEALMAKNKEIALKLLDYNKESACLANAKLETPLHLLANNDPSEFAYFSLAQYTETDVEKMVEAYVEATELPDKPGLTPVMTALTTGNIELATMLITRWPGAAKLDHPSTGQNFWHLLVTKSSGSHFVVQALCVEVLRHKLSGQDSKGNTALHLAIIEKRFDMVQSLLDPCENPNFRQQELSRRRELSNNYKDEWLPWLLEIPNNDGETPQDLIADSPNLPPNLEICLMSDPKYRGLRSSWGIPRTHLQNYMNSMNVIAALQTTITFTAAFAVPGGLNQDIGTPILIQSIPFQIFMISDVIAMCLSMMVLICLLWMVATSKRQSVMIQDFAVSLLLASFVATLLTFMMGVYATVIPHKPWIAITTLVLCSSLMLLVHRFMVTRLLLPFRNAIVNCLLIFSKEEISRVLKLALDKQQSFLADSP